MNKEDVLKIVIGVGAGWAAFSIATAVYANYQKKKHEEATIDALVKTEAIGSGSNFSGTNGLRMPKVYKCLRNGKVYYSKAPCPKGEGTTTTTPVLTCDVIGKSIIELEYMLKIAYSLPENTPDKYKQISNLKSKIEYFKSEYVKMACGGVRRDTGDYCQTRGGGDGTWQGTGGNAGYCVAKEKS